MLLPVAFGAVVGISLGLTGGGGSIFAVPLLHFGLGLPLRGAVMVSLAVVGLTALFGAVLQWRAVRWPAGLVLGLGGFAGAPLGSAAGGRLPEGVTLVLFALLMGLVAWRMWRGGAVDVPLPLISCRLDPGGEPHFHLACAAKLCIAGAVTGVLAGVFGVGGGFLVVPALVAVAGLRMGEALATSLVAIAIISGAALGANLLAPVEIEPGTPLWFLLGSSAGMAVGIVVKRFFSDLLLKKIFAGAMLGVALFILGRAAF